MWFARLQMPVLRVAVTEPDFRHCRPSGAVADRPHGCLRDGFDSSTQAAWATRSRRRSGQWCRWSRLIPTPAGAFQTATEFEKFLEHHFSIENETTKKGVSLAAKVGAARDVGHPVHHQSWRRMLNEVLVQEGVRQFLFQVWPMLPPRRCATAQRDETRAP